eukprot:3715657-Pyramimonas_sp.AAC.1
MTLRPTMDLRVEPQLLTFAVPQQMRFLEGPRLDALQSPIRPPRVSPSSSSSSALRLAPPPSSPWLRRRWRRRSRRHCPLSRGRC